MKFTFVNLIYLHNYRIIYILSRAIVGYIFIYARTIISRGVAFKQTISLLVTNIPTFNGERHQWRLNDFVFVSRPSFMNLSQVTQNGIEFRKEPAEYHLVAMEIGWIDILQQGALTQTISYLEYGTMKDTHLFPR